MKTDFTTLSISKQTKNKLENFGHKGESYDALILRLLGLVKNE